MKKTLYIIFMLSMLSCSKDKNTNPTTDVGKIKGFVYDQITNERITDAYIETNPLTSSMKTRSDGTFELFDISPGTYSLIVSKEGYQDYNKIIKVSNNLVNNLEIPLKSFVSTNTPPNTPILITPENNATISNNTINFTWNCIDKDNDELEFSIYLSKKDENFILIAENIKTFNFKFTASLDDGSTYNWKVIAKDKYSETASPVNTFIYKKSQIDNLSGLIGHWKLDNNALDSSPNGFNGTEENVTYVVDRNNKQNSAASFNGEYQKINSKIVLGNKIHLNSTFTISLWVKQSVTLGENGSAGNFDCVSQWGGAGYGLASYNFGIDWNQNVFFTTYNSNNDKKNKIYLDKLSTEEWYHIAVTFDNGTVRYYLNGKFKNVESGFPYPQLSNLNVCIGGRQDQLSSFHGAIDDVYIFNKVLTDQEVLNLFQE